MNEALTSTEKDSQVNLMRPIASDLITLWVMDKAARPPIARYANRRGITLKGFCFFIDCPALVRSQCVLKML